MCRLRNGGHFVQGEMSFKHIFVSRMHMEYLALEIKWRLGIPTNRNDFFLIVHYNDVIMSAMVSQITGVSIIYSTVCSGEDQRRQTSVSLAFVGGIHCSQHKGPVTRRMFPFDDVIMFYRMCNVRWTISWLKRVTLRDKRSLWPLTMLPSEIIMGLGWVISEQLSSVNTMVQLTKRNKNKVRISSML